MEPATEAAQRLTALRPGCQLAGGGGGLRQQRGWPRTGRTALLQGAPAGTRRRSHAGHASLQRPLPPQPLLTPRSGDAQGVAGGGGGGALQSQGKAGWGGVGDPPSSGRLRSCSLQLWRGPAPQASAPSRPLNSTVTQPCWAGAHPGLEVAKASRTATLRGKVRVIRAPKVTQ